MDLARFTPDDGLARQGEPTMPEGDEGPSRVKVTHDGAARLLFYHPDAADGERSSPDIRHNGVDYPVDDPEAWARAQTRLTSSPNASRTPSLEADLSAAPRTTYRITWFHPTTGESYEEGRWRRLGLRTFHLAGGSGVPGVAYFDDLSVREVL